MLLNISFYIGIHAFFGAFISGLCIPRKGELTDFLAIRIELIIVEFFLPYVHSLPIKILLSINIIIHFSLYFANSGLQTHLNLLNTGKAWWTLLVLIILASTAKIVPVTLVSKLCSKKPWFYCLSIGVLMNTRGIVQLVVLNIGVELGVISPMLFAIFVLLATILTFLTSPILSILYRKNYDIQKLSVPNVAEELRSVREGELNTSELNGSNGNIPTISNGDIYSDQQKLSSTKSSRKSSINMPGHDTFVTFDERIDYAETSSYTNDQEREDIDYTPRRFIKMTRF